MNQTLNLSPMLKGWGRRQPGSQHLAVGGRAQGRHKPLVAREGGHLRPGLKRGGAEKPGGGLVGPPPPHPPVGLRVAGVPGQPRPRGPRPARCGPNCRWRAGSCQAGRPPPWGGDGPRNAQMAARKLCTLPLCDLVLRWLRKPHSSVGEGATPSFPLVTTSLWRDHFGSQWPPPKTLPHSLWRFHGKKGSELRPGGFLVLKKR